MERQDDLITQEIDWFAPSGYGGPVVNGTSTPLVPVNHGSHLSNHNPGMEKYGNAIHTFAGMAQMGYRSNLLGRSTQEVQSTYSVRAEDGKIFYDSKPNTGHYGAMAWEEEAPIDGQRHGYDEEAQAVRASAVRMAMADNYRRGEAKRGGGPHDYVQLAEDMVTHEDEVEQMRALYTRKPKQADIVNQIALRMNGGREVWNDFDFENEYEGGLAAQHRRVQHARKDAEAIEMKNRMDRLYNDLEGNAMDYWSRDFNNRAPTQRETDRAGHDYTWIADQNIQEARPNFGYKMDPLRVELYQNLKTHSLLSKDGRSFIPANLILKVAEMGATHAEQTQLSEMLQDCFGKANLNGACSVKELLHFTEEAAQVEANGPETFRLGRQHAAGGNGRAHRGATVLLSKVSQLLLAQGGGANGRVTKAKQDSIDTTRLVQKYNTRVDFLTEELDIGRITRQKYNQEMYKTLSLFHNDVLETADKYFRRDGFNSQTEKLVTLLDNADRIFQLWAATNHDFGKNMSLNEVNAMKKFIAFNDELLLSRALTKGRAANTAAHGANVELFLKEYAQELEDVIRLSPRFDKLHPGIRAEYKREYTKISQQLDSLAIKAAPRALKESVTALGAVYKEIQNDSRVPQAVKQQVLKQIDMSIGKIDATMADKQAGRVTLRQAYELRNMADYNARMQKELMAVAISNNTRGSRREQAWNRGATLAYEEQHDDGRDLRRTTVRNQTENRGEFGQRQLQSGIMVNRGVQRHNGSGVAQNYHNDIGPSAYGSSNRSGRFGEGTMADTIANAGYSSAF